MSQQVEKEERTTNISIYTISGDTACILNSIPETEPQSSV